MPMRVLMAVLWVIATLAVAAVAALLCGAATALAGLATNRCDAMCYQWWPIGIVLGFLAVCFGSALLWERRHRPSPSTAAGRDALNSNEDVESVDE